ncbi:MAG: nucleoside triphosphate pyrophosphohydrolase, partial [Lentisphaerae bacterium]
PKLHEEIDELAEAVAKSDRDAMEDELGDLLFAVVNLSRKLGIDAELALQRASGKFSARFRKVEQIFAGEQREMSDVGLAELDAVWDRVKQEDGNTP